MGRAGRSFVEQYFDIAKLNQRLAFLYLRLLRGEPIIDFEKALAEQEQTEEPEKAGGLEGVSLG